MTGHGKPRGKPVKRTKHYADREKLQEYKRRMKESYRRRTGASRTAGGPSRPYSAEEDALIVAHGMPDRELAEKIGRSVGAIQKRRWRLGGGRKLAEGEFNYRNAAIAVSADTDRRIREELKEGRKAMKQIAAEFGVSRSAVYNRKMEMDHAKMER